MTTSYEPSRDNAGRFATPEHTAPELTLAEQAYLEDGSDGSDFDMNAYYDAVHGDPEAHARAFETWADENRREQQQQQQQQQQQRPDGGFDTGHTAEEEAAFSEWLDESRTPQGMDEFFDREDPTLLPPDRPGLLTIGAWGSETPF